MPPSSRSVKPGSLTAKLDAKVLGLVRQYIDNAVESGDTTIFHKKTGTLSIGTSELYSYVTAVGDGPLQRTKRGNVEKSIEKAIEAINSEQDRPAEKGKKTRKGLREPGDEFDGDADGMLAVSDDGDGDDDDDGGAELGGDLIEIKDTNATNKRITELWGLKQTRSGDRPPSSRAASVPPPTTTSTFDKPMTANSNPLPTEATTDDKTPVTSLKKRKEKSSSSKEKEGKESKRRKADNGVSRAPPTHISLADLGGIDDIISDVLELIALPLTHPEMYLHLGVPPPRGVLFHGPPGCGKTMIANAIAGEIGLPFISVSAPSIVSGMSGESEKQLRDLFDEAREKAPCILFLDEIDAITPKRESAQREMERRIVAQMLTCMDDLTLEKTGGRPVVIIGATNRPDSLDPALRRGGRFDREICIGVPDEEGREKILKVLSKKLRLAEDFDFRQLAKMTPGFVGADLNALTAAAGVCAIKRIFHTLKDVIPGAAVADAVETGDTTTLSRVIEESSEPDPEPDPNSSAMDLDTSEHHQPPTSTTTITPPITDPRSNIFHTFLTTLTAPFTTSQLSHLSVTLTDFLTALPKIQPSSKREGFATVPDVTWSDIGALHSVRTKLQMAIVQPIKHPEIFASVGLTAPTGVLLWGPPGCGKTLLAKAVANESRANFISVKGPELLNKYVGESERAVRQVFTRARASSPCVIFFDELDALVPARADSLSDASSRVVNTLLTELDGLSDRQGVYVVGATNRPDAVDPAMLRPGRLDKSILIDIPTPEERVEILKTLATRRKVPVEENVDFVKLGMDMRCDGFSGADLAALLREAATGRLLGDGLLLLQQGGGDEFWGGGNETIKLTMEDFDRAFSEVKPSVSKKQLGQYKVLASRFER